MISKYGFAPDGEGVVQFTQTVKMLERQDPEVARLNLLVKQHLLPPTSGSVRSSGDAGYACSSVNLSNAYNQSDNSNQNQYYLPNHQQPSGHTYTNRHY